MEVGEQCDATTGKDTGHEVEEPGEVHPELGCQVHCHRHHMVHRLVKEQAETGRKTCVLQPQLKTSSPIPPPKKTTTPLSLKNKKKEQMHS